MGRALGPGLGARRPMKTNVRQKTDSHICRQLGSPPPGMKERVPLCEALIYVTEDTSGFLAGRVGGDVSP